MGNDNAIWITGTVIGASGYPRKNAEVRGVVYAGDRKVAAGASTTDYSGQYFLTIELPETLDVETDCDELRVALSAASSGETSEYAGDVIWLEGHREMERELHLETRGEQPPLLRAA